MPYLGLCGNLRRILQPDSDRQGYAVRIDWPGTGARPVSHDFVRFTSSVPRVWQRAAGTRAFWQRGPLQPLAVTVAPMTWSAFATHRQQCSSLDCPTVASLYGMAGGEGVCVQQQG